MFLTPAVLFIIASLVLPLIWTIVLSMQEWDGFHSPEWVGLSNYRDSFGSKVLMKSLLNSVYYGLASTAWSVILGLFTATLLLNMGRKEGGFFRLVLYSPAMLPIAVVGMMFVFFYNPTIGVVNQLLEIVGLERFQQVWLQDSRTAMPAIIVAAVWKNMGANMVLCFAAMQAIPKSLYESSYMDGADFWRQTFSITYPLIRPMILLTTINTLGRQYKSYGIIKTMTDGGPGNLTATVPIQIVKTGFGFGYFGSAASMAVILTIVVAISILITRFVLNGDSYEF
jgi:ABC-type sugar transport system permease subunit